MADPVSSGDDTSLGAIRCSDGEREQTRSRLAQAAGEGRITVEELDDRLALVAGARFRHELDAVAADLPRPESQAARERPGWLPILATARRQLSADATLLVGRGQVAVSRRRRWAVFVAAVAVALIFTALVLATVHGFGDEGFDHHELGRG
ncbi:DUF1707 domain-containing protein [Amycolatopsis sp. cmx-8-4]|uniref:DUF1707 SHOCT-like domain-containing protein n=1 Tax=Amycolatopsis sp. cmx-8-4 TaxID=2790947 RepID=UPI0039798E9B